MTITKRASDAFASLPPIPVADLVAGVGPAYWFALGFEHPDRPSRFEAGQVEPKPARSANPIIRSGDIKPGKRYRIVETYGGHQHNVGEIVTCLARNEFGDGIHCDFKHQRWSAGKGKTVTYVTAVQLVEDEPEQPAPEPNDSGVIHATEGVVLRPGEYRYQNFTFGIAVPVRAERIDMGRGWGWFVPGNVGWVTAVRRIEPVAAPLVEPGEDCADCVVADGCKRAHELQRECDELRAKVGELLEQRRKSYAGHELALLERNHARKDLAELRTKVGELKTEVLELEASCEAGASEFQMQCALLVECRGKLANEVAAHSRAISESRRRREGLDVAERALAARDSEIASHADELRGHTNHCAEAIQAERRAVAELNAESIAKDAEIARLRRELAAEQRACTQLHCDVSNAWARFRDSGEGDANNELWDKLQRISASNPHASPPTTEASEPAPRPILVGSYWTNIAGQVTVYKINDDVVTYGRGLWNSRLPATVFRRQYDWGSDPAPSEVAPVTGSGT